MKFTDSVRQYYDKNTDRFLRWGADEGTANIHGALWAPGVTSLHDAMHYANQLVFEQAQKSNRQIKSIIDLGCGVGSGLFYLNEKLPHLENLIGVSLSSVQIEHARNKALGKNHFQFIVANFQDLPDGLGPVDLAYAIEAFDHSPDANIFFEQVSQTIQPGGRLIIIDDFLTDKGEKGKLDNRSIQLLRIYQSHWLMGSLLHPERVSQLAKNHGLSLSFQQDLTPWLRIRRPRDRAISLAIKLASPLFDKTSYLRMLKGGDAKQKCYLKGLTKYQMLVLDKG